MNYEEHMLWLKNNCRPWETVTEYWSLTSKKRLKDLQSNTTQSCQEYMYQFPALSDPSGFVLLENDFETLYPDHKLKLYVNWPKLSSFVMNKVTTKLKNRFNDVFLPAQNWRPSRKESEEGFILHIKTIADLETRLQERTAKLLSFGQPSQPIAVIVGPSFDEIKQCFIVINTFRYEVETPIKAVDLIFKLCNTLNIRYPLEVGQLFMFLQRGVYGIETVWDKQKNSQLTSSVLATVQEYKSLKS
ncbi:PREDICTED: uncharacterized protein LOC105556851 [Vollenhovia emeryi]|uniref:uncharacterized protein LOC105556851 n=1 Tax=Vollenhovia emeryi TaxID=411798 RepID=UPI0005F5257F|nr:PREDICTED: uncharacterized protein LOC105556851 [Vollenhovia emeryi]